MANKSLSASLYGAGDGYQSGDILTGGEESGLSDPGSDLGDIDDTGEEYPSEQSYSRDKWHTPSRHTHKNRDSLEWYVHLHLESSPVGPNQQYPLATVLMVLYWEH